MTGRRADGVVALSGADGAHVATLPTMSAWVLGEVLPVVWIGRESRALRRVAGKGSAEIAKG